MNPRELWQAALGELEFLLSRANFTTWFRNTSIASFEGGRVIIVVPNTFTKAWLEKKYHAAIVQSLQKITNETVKEITYKVENQIQPSAAPGTEVVVTMPSAPELPTQATNFVGLNPRYTFSTFIVGKGNALAHAAAKAVVDRPGTAYNPLFIYGGSGLGKTHLLQAVGHAALERSPQAKVLYVTSERFTNEYIAAVRGQRMREFRETYRSVDMLLVDDIHFIAAKEGTQEEFFHTFNALHQVNKQILISSDRPPKSIPGLEERLVTRFECGMLADVSSPDLETRIAILEEKCKEKNFLLDKGVVHYIASVIQSNVRELEGALNKVIAYHQFKNVSPTLETTKPILSGFMPERRRGSVTPKTLVEAVANHYGIGVEDLLSQSRERRLSFPRQIAAYLLREELKSSFPAIGKELGGRDHTTAMHACTKISCALQTDTRLRQDIDRIRERLFGN